MKRTKEFRRFQWFKHRDTSKRVLEPIVGEVSPCDIGKAEGVHNCFCSGPCCGNPRKWFGEVTVQEKRNEQDERLSD
jgi:hypothetical protein